MKRPGEASLANMGNRRRLRVLFVAAPAPLGGSNVSLADVLRAVSDRIERWVAAPKGAFLERVHDERLAERVLTIRPGRGPVGRLHQSFDLLRALRSSPRVDVVHANSTSGLMIAALSAAILRFPVVTWLHDMAPTRSRELTGPTIRRLLASRVPLRFAAVSNIARAAGVANGLAPAWNICMIPNPIDSGTIRARDWEPGRNVRVAFLGNSGARKGFDVLVQAIGATKELDLEWRLFTRRRPGPSDRHWWNQLDRLDQLGSRILRFDPVADVRVIYRAADIVFVPSRQESFGRVVAEAMLNGLPVVASDIGPFREMVHDVRAGLLFSPGNAVGAAAQIRRLSAEPELRQEMGRRGRSWVEANCGPALVAKALLDLYKEAAREGAAWSVWQF